MLKIGTHDSATGEKGVWWSLPLSPFAKTQKKTIREQYDAGCRLFDLRIKKVKKKWRMCHGWWFTKRTAESIFEELNSFEDACSVTITYEGKTKNTKEFLLFVHDIKAKYTHIKYGEVSSKYGEDSSGIKVKYDILMNGDPQWIDAPCRSHFLKLDGRSWHTYFPLPWLWKKIYYNEPDFREDIYTYVDFL